MRTTMNIDEHLLNRAKQRARERGVPLGTVVDEALRALLTRVDPAGPRSEPPTLRLGGFRPGIDPHSNASIFDAMDDEAPGQQPGQQTGVA